MKIISAFAAVVLLACHAAAAAEAPAAPSARPVKHPSVRVCNKRADARQLSGAVRAQFVKDCREGKT